MMNGTIWCQQVNRRDYLSVRSLFATSMLEKEGLFGIGLQKKIKRKAVEIEYGIYNLWGSFIGEPTFEDDARGNRIRVNLKYYLSNFVADEYPGLHLYTSIMPSYTQVHYRLQWWTYDTVIGTSTTKQKSDHPVNYSSKNTSMNLLTGNECFLHG